MSVERLLIVGGGIAGLATAAGLARDGIACEVVERAERWAPLGAGIVLSVNAMAVLRGLGLAEGALARGAVLARGAITDARAREIAVTDFAALEPAFGPTLGIHRADLHEILLAGAAKVPVTLGASVDELHSDASGVDVRLSDGREARFDLVLGADGLRSRVRELLFGALPLAYSGYTCWRFALEGALAEVELREMWGRGLRFGVAPIGGGRVYGYAVANAPRGAADPEAGRVARLRERFAGFGGQVPELLAAIERPEQLIHNDLEELAQRRWSKGRVVLLGDAAHAMTPNMGQGAAMALEDSAVLLELIRAGTQAREIGARLRARRERRVRFVQAQSRRIGRIGQWHGRLACGLRDGLLRALPGGAPSRALRRLASQPL
jgi:2-polyprenyl-6-methoxyphenol hydroxylase-like FAD-dependent oxidoreductase